VGPRQRTAARMPCEVGMEVGAKLAGRGRGGERSRGNQAEHVGGDGR